MAEDRRIIIQVEGSESGGGKKAKSPTVPKAEGNETEPEKEEATDTFDFKKVLAVAKNPMGAAVAEVSSAVPYVAAAIAAAAVIAKTADSAIGFAADYTGDATTEISWNNFKTTMGNVTNPMGYAMSFAKQSLSIYNQNKSLDQQRLLLGNADLNSFYGRGS